MHISVLFGGCFSCDTNVARGSLWGRRSNTRCETRERFVWRVFRCHAFAASQSLSSGVPYKPGCPSSTWWWLGSHTPKFLAPPWGKMEQKSIRTAWTFLSFHEKKLIMNYNHTCWISLKSWLTSIMPPSNSLTASARASIVSMSKWLVGSSRNNMCGFCQASQAKHTRHFWPSDRFLMGLTCGTFQTFLLKPSIFLTTSPYIVQHP